MKYGIIGNKIRTCIFRMRERIYRNMITLILMGILPAILMAETPPGQNTQKSQKAEKLFTLLNPDLTNIYFNNELVDKE